MTRVLYIAPIALGLALIALLASGLRNREGFAFRSARRESDLERMVENSR